VNTRFSNSYKYGTGNSNVSSFSETGA